MANNILEMALELLEHEQKFLPSTLSAWFGDATVVSFTDNRLVLHSPSDFKQKYITDKFIEPLQNALYQLTGEAATVVVVTGEYSTPAQSASPYDDYTFERFIVGSSNKFAHAAAYAVAQRPAAENNPLFIYGNSGLGKTHLMYAIANVLRRTHPEFRIIYVKGEDFTNELITAIQKADVQSFRNKYRVVDLLLLDDVQFIAGKERTQEEFFHTFNALYEAKKQIVLTSDRPPKEINTLEERMKTRFEWGLLADIQPPDYETRMAIIKNKAMQLGTPLPDSICTYIAENVTANVRQLEGTVKKILAYRDLNNMPLDLPNVSRAIDDMFKSEGNALPTPSLIISQVCKFYSVDENVLRGTLKNKGVAEARQMAMYLIRKLTNLSLPDIGKEFAKDHSTVLYAIRKVEVALKNGDKTIQENIQTITANINACL